MRLTDDARRGVRVLALPPMPKRVRLLTPARPAWAGLAGVAFALLPGVGAAAVPAARAADHRSGRDRRAARGARRAGGVARQVDRAAGGAGRPGADRTAGRVSLDPVAIEADAADAIRPSRFGARAIALTALSQSGLFYAVNEYDIDRYRKLGALAAELLAAVTDDPAAHWRLELGRDAGYATPKVDVRGALVDEQERILLMRERSDGRWSLPGGWADPLDTPSRAVEREILEETGHGARAVKLVGCWDRDTQGHLPKLPFSIYKLFFLCEATGEVRPPDALETLDVGWFALDALPELSTGRINARQLGRISRTTGTRCCPPSSTEQLAEPLAGPASGLRSGARPYAMRFRSRPPPSRRRFR